MLSYLLSLGSSYHVLLLLVVALGLLYKLAAQLWWRGEAWRGSVPKIYRRGGESRLCDHLVRNCSALTERYTPPVLWGSSGHIQTFFFGAVGRFGLSKLPSVPQERCSVVVEDGSTVFYDVFQPVGDGASHLNHIMLVCPGIGNSSECDYVRVFVHYATSQGFRVVVQNHVGALKNVDITGNRIFTYGGTGDLTAVYNELCAKYPPETKFIAVGFSMGSCITLRFLGEDPERQKRFVCAVSTCQGYDPSRCFSYMYDWTGFRRLYNHRITTSHMKIIRRNSQQLFSTPQAKSHCQTDTSASFTQGERGDIQAAPPSGGREGEISRNLSSRKITHGEFDCSGFNLDRTRTQAPDLEKLWKSNSMSDLDEYFTRRVQGFDTVYDLHKWTSCDKLMYGIDTLPVLLLNAMDDPLVPEFMHDIPKKYTEHNPNAMFVTTDHGGHLGFFEGGVLEPNQVAWVDKLIVQYTNACIDAEKLISY